MRSRTFIAWVAGVLSLGIQFAATAQPVEYVRVCDAFGTGYFYIPGTETCIRIEAGVDAGLTRTSVELGNVFARTGGGGTDTSSLAESDTSARLGGDVRIYVPLNENGFSAFAGGWSAPLVSGSQEFIIDVTYAPGDTARLVLQYQPNLFTAYGGIEAPLTRIGGGNLSGAVYGGGRFSRLEVSHSGDALTPYAADQSSTLFVPIIGAELTYRPEKGSFGNFVGRLGVQYQGGATETLSSSTAGADITSTFEVKSATHVYFQIARPLFIP